MLFLVRNCPFVRQIAIQLRLGETSVRVYFLCKLVHMKGSGSLQRKVEEKRVLTIVSKSFSKTYLFIKQQEKDINEKITWLII